MFPQSTSVFTSAVTKLTKKRFRLQMNKIIMVVEIVEQFATVLTRFRCFLPNAHCSHDSSLHYWLYIYCHINNEETLPASDDAISEQPLVLQTKNFYCFILNHLRHPNFLSCLSPSHPNSISSPCPKFVLFFSLFLYACDCKLCFFFVNLISIIVSLY